jgi:hypothetical protein
MISRNSVFAPLGRVHEPLLELAARIQRATVKRPQTLWIDDRGGVFLNDPTLLQSKPHGSIIGTYGAATSLAIIERDLRLTLRERARRWILDWDMPASIARREKPASAIPPKARRKQRKAKAESEQMLESA